jgi:hypothetical protein
LISRYSLTAPLPLDRLEQFRLAIVALEDGIGSRGRPFYSVYK